MGRWATYIVGGDGDDHPAAHTRHGGTADGWAWWELPAPRGESWDPGPGDVLIAYVYDSDSVVICGLRDREAHWQWTFGESSAAFYEGREVYDQDLEESLPGRAAEVAEQIAAWAGTAGLPEVDRAVLTEILQTGQSLAEDGFSGILAALGILRADSTVGRVELEPAIDPDQASSQGPMERAQAEIERRIQAATERRDQVAAAPIDHTSYVWQEAVARNHLYQYGEPPALVAIGEYVYVASDPPVSLGPDALTDERFRFPGPWTPVPPEYAGELLTAARWARENIGTPGEPMWSERWPLTVELGGQFAEDDANAYLNHADWYQYRIGSPRSTGADLVLEGDPLQLAEPVADWLDAARTAIALPMAGNYSIGPVVYGEEGDHPGWALRFGANGITKAGRWSSGKPDDAGWLRMLRKLRSGQYISLRLEADALDGFGQAQDIQPWGSFGIEATLAASIYTGLKPPATHLSVHLSDPLKTKLLRKGDWLTDLVELARATLPVAEVR